MWPQWLRRDSRGLHRGAHSVTCRAATLNTHAHDDLLRSLRSARNRMRAQWFLERFTSFVFCAAFALLALSATRRWLLHAGPLPLAWWVGGPALAVVAAFLAAWARRVEWREVARLVDRRGGTRDRSLTALSFAENPSPFQQLAADECRVFLAKQDLGRLIPVRVPHGLGWLVIPVVAAAFLQWDAHLAADARQVAAEAAQARVQPTAQQLEKLAQQIEETLNPAGDESIKKLAEQLKKSAEQLRAQENGADEAAKAALRELSALQEMLQQMQKAPAGASPEELARLAEELAKNEATRAAAEAMRTGDLAQAARELEEAARQPSKEEAEKTLREALDRLAKQRELSEAMQQLAKKLQPQGGEGAPGEGLQKLAKMLQQMGQQKGSSGKPGQQPSGEQLKNLLAALENMKFGEPQDSDGSPTPGDGKGDVTLQSFAKPNPGGGAPDNSQVPAGQPGGERDTGTTETPFGKNPGEAARAGSEAALKGRLNEGESLSQLLPASSDEAKSGRRYKELYEAMAPAAENAVVQENIPLGSRFLIKRYFESIRPRE